MDTNILPLAGSAGAPAQDTPRPLSANQAEYRQLCRSERSIPVFSSPWWLDATAGEGNWDVALARVDGRIVAAMPYTITTRLGMKVLGQPLLTPALGPWFLPQPGKKGNRSATEQKLMLALIEELPRFDHFRQSWSPGMSNWLPFYWNGFGQTTEYTYVVHGLHDLDGVWNGMDQARRRHCRQAEERHGMRVRDDLPLDDMLALQKMTLQHRGVTPPYSDELVRRIDAACRQHGCGKLLTVVDATGRPCAATYTIWDGIRAYAWIKGSDPELQHTGAPSLCQWESIKFSAAVAGEYDFLGNMNKTIEPYVRSFGTVQTPVFSISKTPSRLLRLRQGLKSALAR